MSKTITLDETLCMVSEIKQEIPDQIAKQIVATATRDSVQNIGGFPITDHLLVDDRLVEAKNRRAAAIKAFEVDKEYLVTKLASMRITDYLAIVPTAYWKNLCDRHHLQTARPDMNGKVSVNTKVPYDLTEKARQRWNAMSGIIGAFAALCTICAVIAFLNSATDYFLFGTALAVCSGFLSWGLSHIGVRRGQTAILRHLQNTSYGQLIGELLKPTSDYRWSISAAHLILPAPPLNVVLLLRKLRDARELFTVTADPNAFHLNPSVETLYMKGHAIEIWRQHQEKLDPIITIAQNNATAVLAQFGEFKWELEVIEDILSGVSVPTTQQSDHQYY